MKKRIESELQPKLQIVEATFVRRRRSTWLTAAILASQPYQATQSSHDAGSWIHRQRLN